VSGELPKGWALPRLEELLDFVIGGDWGKAPETDDEGLTDAYCIRGTEFRHWDKESGETRVLRKVKFSSLEKRVLKKGDILIEISGGGPDQPVGRTVLIDAKSLAVKPELPSVCTNFIRLARPSAKLDAAYLNYYLKTFYLSGEVTNYQGGSNNLRNLKFKEYSTIPIPFAPLNEQIRIANKLDSLLAKVGTVQTRLEKIPTLLKRFRQSILAAATSGELTTEWRTKYPDLITWSEQVLGDIAVVFTGVTPLKKETSYYEGGSIPWLTSSVTGLDLVTEAKSFVTEKALKECRLKLFNPGTLLIAMYGEGKTRGQVTEIAIEATINQACAAVVVNQELASNKYVKICIEANYEKTRMMAEGGNQPNLNLSKVRNIPINLPSEQEQKEIVRRVESLFALADSVEKQYTEAKKRTDRLTQSLLAKAFRGELVPQDPNDEPASELLKRIQAEREIQLASKPKRKAAKGKAL